MWSAHSQTTEHSDRRARDTLTSQPEIQGGSPFSCSDSQIYHSVDLFIRPLRVVLVLSELERIGATTGETLSPFWRAFFGSFWVIPLLGRIRERAIAERVPVGWSAAWLGALWTGLQLASLLPDPFWLVSFTTSVALSYAVDTTNRINDHLRLRADKNNHYSAANVATIVVGGLLVSLVVWSRFVLGV